MNIKRSVKVLLAKAYKNRATIEAIVGGVLIVGGTVVIISKAGEAVEITNELESRNDYIRKMDATDGWTDKKERNHEVKSMVGFGIKGYAKAYALGLGMQAAGLTLEAVSHVTQCKELSAMSALCATYATTLSAVKERVIADQGEEKWQEYLLGPQFTTVDVMPDGTIVQTTEPIDNPNRSANLPPHCFFFDESNPNWEKDAMMNRDFLENHERWLNDKLWNAGFLFENDIRRDLGIPIVKSGWTSGILAEDKDGNRNFLKLGLDAKNPAAQSFRDGIEPTILLQPNVEDNIIEQLKLELI